MQAPAMSALCHVFLKVISCEASLEANISFVVIFTRKAQGSRQMAEGRMPRRDGAWRIVRGS
jgi:hypothetical protein